MGQAAEGDETAEDEHGADDRSAVHERTEAMRAAEIDATEDDWILEPCGAARADETAFVCLSGPLHVRVLLVVDGRSSSQLVPSSVLAHVLRAQEAAG
jgi:hypothetical protein